MGRYIPVNLNYIARNDYVSVRISSFSTSGTNKIKLQCVHICKTINVL